MNRSLGVKFPQAGYSLTELMVAITIGLIILGGTLQVFTASKESFRLQEGVSRAQETGRMGIFILNRSLRHTGFYRNPSLVPSGFRIAFPAVAANGTTPAFLVGSAVSGTDGGGANPDLVAIRHQQHEDGTLLDCHGIVFDCMGEPGCNANPVTSPIMGIYTFSLGGVDADTGTRSLQCRRQIPAAGINPVNPQPLIEGVTDFQVWYGVDTDLGVSKDNIPNRFRSADTMAAADWPQVVALRIRLQTNSVDTVVGGTATNRIEQIYNSVIYLRDPTIVLP